MLDGPILLVAGARPNFMKVAPIQHELDRRGVPNLLVHTGQHHEPSMSDVFFDELGMRPPDVALGVGSASHAVQTARVMEAFEPVVLAQRPSWVVVVGDVNSTLAAALVAAKLRVRLAHVEAGLRSGDRTMPEEVNRVVTDRVSDLLLAPSEDAVDNLRAEGLTEGVVLVGNVMVDTLLANLERARATHPAEGGHVLLTLHRPSNVDDPATFGALLAAVAGAAAPATVVFPVHPRTRTALAVTEVPANVRPVEPFGYLESISMQASARLVVTDSGGLQEESTVLGTPCLTVRTTTERPITITDGTNRLVGVEPAAVAAAITEALAAPPPARRPALWDGKAAVRVADALLGS